MGREEAPVLRAREREAELQRQEALRIRTKGLDKVFYLLFWLMIPGTVGIVLSPELLAKWFPALGVIGGYIRFLSSLAYGIVLFSQYKRQWEYRIAGILSVVACVLRFIRDNNAPPEGTGSLMTVIGLAAGVIQLVSVYKEFTAHSEVMTGVDELAYKWRRLWTWTIGAYCAVLGSVIVAIIAPLLGVLLVLAGSIGMIVVEIVKVVYLHHSAQACQEY